MKTEHKIGFLFDLDGVIIDSEREYDKIWESLNQEFPTGVFNLQKKIKGCTLKKILDDYYKDSETRKAVEERLHFLEKKMTYSYLGGAQQFLKELRRKSLATALVTSSDWEKMRNLVSQIPGILDYFDFVVTGNLVTKSKPDPEGYLLAASQIGIDPANCIVFEDSLQGVKAGRASKAYVVGIYGTLEAETISPYCDIVVGDLAEIHLADLMERVMSR